MLATKLNYITNKELLAEIHRSKTSFCSYLEPQYASYDAIVDDLALITEDFANEVMIKRNTKTRRGAPVNPVASIDELVFRVMTHEHIPLCDDKKKRSRSVAGQGHIRTNFAPFKHFILRDGVPIEVGRSHWIGGFHNGEFSTEGGKITNRLATMFMLLVDRYSRRGNWRGYSYVDEMRGNALLQLSQVGLQFDEAKSDNPFAFYTQILKNVFTRVLNVERKNQNIRDDMLIMAGATPSHTRQVDNELAQKSNDVVLATTAPAKRGRKAKALAAATPSTED